MDPLLEGAQMVGGTETGSGVITTSAPYASKGVGPIHATLAIDWGDLVPKDARVGPTSVGTNFRQAANP